MMLDTDKFKEIWQTISRNKLRSFLTGFGVAWGILMFVILSGVGNGFKHGIDHFFTGIATNSLYVFTRPTTMEYKGLNAGREWTLSLDDIELLKKQIPDIEEISATVFTNFNKAAKEDKACEASVTGISTNYFSIENVSMLQGRPLNFMDDDEKRKVCLIGEAIANALFIGEEDIVGDFVTVNGIQFTVVGVLHGEETVTIGGNVNNSIYVPLRTIQQISGYGNAIHSMCIQANEDAAIEEVQTEVQTLLKIKHKIHPDDDNAMMVFNLKEFFTSYQNLFLGFNILIWVVGMGALLSGIIGVSNIMLVSVRERTREIGIRRALGAKPWVIMRQILSESVLLSFLAGYGGFFVGVLVLSVLDKIPQPENESFFENPYISFTLAVTVLLILIITGLLAGIIPAKNALNSKAIDALRDE